MRDASYLVLCFVTLGICVYGLYCLSHVDTVPGQFWSNPWLHRTVVCVLVAVTMTWVIYRMDK